MADEAGKEPPVTLQYESPGPVWRSGDYVGCACILVVFLLIAWIQFEFVLSMIVWAFDVRMSPRMTIAAIFASGVLALITTLIAYWKVMRLRR